MSMEVRPKGHHHAPVRNPARKRLQEVPDVHKNALSGPENKIQALQRSISKLLPVNNHDIDYYKKKYNLLDIKPGEPKECGKTGILLIINPNLISGKLIKK